MRWWARARGLGWYIILCAGVSLLSVALQGIGLFAPNFLGGPVNHFPSDYVVSALPMLGWIALFQRSWFAYDEVSLRNKRVAILDLGAMVAPPLVCAASLFLTALPTLQATGRNLVFYSFLSALSLCFARQYFTFVAPVVYILICSTAGFAYAATAPAPWAFILDTWSPSRDMGVLVVGALVTVPLFVVHRSRI